MSAGCDTCDRARIRRRTFREEGGVDALLQVYGTDEETDISICAACLDRLGLSRHPSRGEP